MKSVSSEDAAASISSPDSRKIKDGTQPSPANVVLKDECGDSLWDEVLSQHNDALNVESNDAEQKAAE